MNLDINKLKELLQNNNYLVYELLSNLDDKVLLELEKSKEYKEFFTPVGTNAIYNKRFDKLPLNKNEYDQLWKIQRDNRVSWKRMYYITKMILEISLLQDEDKLSSFDLNNRQRLYEKLILYMGQNDDTLPLVILDIFKTDFDDYLYEILNSGLRNKGEKVVEYFMEMKPEYKFAAEDADTAIFARDLEWFKYIRSLIQEEELIRSDFIQWLLNAGNTESYDIIDYILENENILLDEIDLEEFPEKLKNYISEKIK